MGPAEFDLPDAEILYFQGFLSQEEANALFRELADHTPWQQDEIRLFGKTYAQPRLTSLYGNPGKSYSYSNISMQAHPWTKTLEKIKNKVEEITKTHFNVVLLNFYRDGKDSNGWHADNEKELGTNPVIASLSLGAERQFQLRHNSLAKQKKNILLENGSLLVMKGSTQHYWKHQIPKTTKDIGARINLTFREIR